MAKCNRCHKGGLFTKLNTLGLCARCELQDTKKELERIQAEIQTLQSKRRDEQALLAQAIQAAEQEAQRQLKPVYTQLEIKTDELNRVTQLVDEIRKKGLQLENRVTKLSPLVKSIKHAINDFPEDQYFEDASRFSAGYGSLSSSC